MLERSFEQSFVNVEVGTGADMHLFRNVILILGWIEPTFHKLMERRGSYYLGLTSAISGYLALTRAKKIPMEARDERFAAQTLEGFLQSFYAYGFSGWITVKISKCQLL